MTHGSPHPRPVYVQASPQGAIPLVPQYVLPDGRIVYSNPGTPTQPVIYQAPGPLPPLTIPPGHVAHPMVAQPSNPVGAHVLTSQHPHASNCQECAKPPPPPVSSAQCAQCAPQADCAACKSESSNPCKVPGCKQCPPPVQHDMVVASATRMEAEHWVGRILGFDMSYLRTLPPAEFQEKINVALAKAQEKPQVNWNNCSLHPQAHSPVACAPRTTAHRREIEDWLERMLRIPRVVLRQRSIKQLDALVTAALADFQVHHR